MKGRKNAGVGLATFTLRGCSHTCWNPTQHMCKVASGRADKSYCLFRNWLNDKQFALLSLLLLLHMQVVLCLKMLIIRSAMFVKVIFTSFQDNSIHVLLFASLLKSPVRLSSAECGGPKDQNFTFARYNLVGEVLKTFIGRPAKNF